MEMATRARNEEVTRALDEAILRVKQKDWVRRAQESSGVSAPSRYPLRTPEEVIAALGMRTPVECERLQGTANPAA